ncbi:MAG: polysaccharide deacetylase family protein [Gaiellales bacterium]
MDRRVTLTFDNGPAAGTIEAALEALARHDATATFFVVGRDLARPGVRALVEATARAGHRVGNHTLTHTLLLGDVTDEATLEREIEEAQELLGELGAARLFRPYGGGGILGPHLLSAPAVQHLGAGGYTCVLWNCVPRDWEQPSRWVETALADIATRDWSVVVLHDAERDAMRHLPRFLDELRARGVELVADYPDSCVPIRRGVVQGSLDGIMASEGGCTNGA